MRIEVDQSGKIEQTEMDTIVVLIGKLAPNKILTRREIEDLI